MTILILELCMLAVVLITSVRNIRNAWLPARAEKPQYPPILNIGAAAADAIEVLFCLLGLLFYVSLHFLVIFGAIWLFLQLIHMIF